MDHPNRLEELIPKYENTLLRAALAILGDIPSAEDAVYDTFLRVVEKNPVFKSGEHEKAWLLRVTVNGCYSVLRRRKRHPVEELSDTYPAAASDGPDVLAAVRALAPKERAAVHLFYYEGYSTEEIASLTDQRPGAVRTQLSRARAHLKDFLTE